MPAVSNWDRARSFGPGAHTYERARPGYPRAAVKWLSGAPTRRILDACAGTGKLTAGLVELGHEVFALEPLEEMVALMRASLPAVPALRATAEATSLSGSSLDVVVAGQAFHWFDAGSALQEMGRILKPGGTLGLIWNTRDDSSAG